MIFENIHKANEWFLNYQPLEVDVPYFLDTQSNWEFGDWILFQHIKSQKPRLISRPILAIFNRYNIWDQALVISFLQKKRAWTWFHKVTTSPTYDSLIIDMDDELEHIQFWTDNIYLLQHWKSKPTLGQLKESLKKQIVSTSEKRDDQISQLLK